MKKTLRNIVGGLGLLTLVSGCTGLGAVMATSDDPATRAIGTIMYHDGAHQDKIKEQEAGRNEVNVYHSKNDITACERILKEKTAMVKALSHLLENAISEEDKIVLNYIKTIPRVVCGGDVNKDGYLDWYYYDGNGNKYNAIKMTIYKNIKSSDLQKKYSKCITRFAYFNEKKAQPIPENTLIIGYQGYTQE
ncbi:MAG: hypothetical protein KKG94_04025 [Nanoarchaeota archaeon]|nr:hypothetical protein [Nanoarchaeota archaeon]